VVHGHSNRKNSSPSEKQSKPTKATLNLAANQPQVINHKLNTRKVRVVALNANGDPIRGRTSVIDANSVEFTPLAREVRHSVTVSGIPGNQSFFKDALDLTTRMLIGVQTISVNYSINGGTVLPGYLPEPRLFGAGAYYPENNMFGNTIDPSFAPGLPFLAGWQDYNFARMASRNGWVTIDSTLNLPYLFTKNERLNIRTTVEPLPDLRVDVTAERSFSKNISEFYNYNNATGEFNANSFTETGNFSMSTLTWGTAFFVMGKGEVHNSEAFEKFKEYRQIIATRLAAQRDPNNGFGYNPNVPHAQYPDFPDGYGPNSVEVLVPAFLAAYQNKDPKSVDLACSLQSNSSGQTGGFSMRAWFPKSLVLTKLSGHLTLHTPTVQVIT
jgi:cell surface protein SprA